MYAATSVALYKHVGNWGDQLSLKYFLLDIEKLDWIVIINKWMSICTSRFIKYSMFLYLK